MFCNSCGSQLTPGAIYCTHCGTAVAGGGVPMAAAPRAAMGAAGRVVRHRNILGILWLVRACMVLFPAMFLLGLSHVHRWSGSYWGYSDYNWSNNFPHFFASLLGGIGVGLLILALAAVAAGIGLLAAERWARMLAIVVGIVELISIPFGTALGIYTLWVLIPEQSDLEYRHLAQARGR